MEEYCRSEFLGVLENSVSLVDLGQKLENLESGSLFGRCRRRWRCLRFSFPIATAAGSDFRRGGPRWNSDTGDLSCLGKRRVHSNSSGFFPNTTPNRWAHFLIGFITSLSPIQCYPHHFLLHPLTIESLVLNWALAHEAHAYWTLFYPVFLHI